MGSRVLIRQKKRVDGITQENMLMFLYNGPKYRDNALTNYWLILREPTVLGMYIGNVKIENEILRLYPRNIYLGFKDFAKDNTTELIINEMRIRYREGLGPDLGHLSRIRDKIGDISEYPVNKVVEAISPIIPQEKLKGKFSKEFISSLQLLPSAVPSL